ncbi:hypothetical protein AB0E25_33275 [Streptomyces bobili]|uniref:hypothetical protein n=1 Tax=Streptomyces bobili TaxID=67280 RepID=UPI0033D66487
MQEAIPVRPAPKPADEPWTPAEQARHLAELEAALDGWHSTDHRDTRKRVRHLRVVDDNAA